METIAHSAKSHGSILSAISTHSNDQEAHHSWLNWIKRPTIQEIDLMLFGACLILGSQYNTWNTTLAYGYWLTLTNLLYVGSAYVCLCLCMSEMSSALPFSGGIFGFVRATTGPFHGFIVACFELLLNLSFVISLVSQICNIPLSLEQTNNSFRIEMALIVYPAVLIICLIGGKLFWSLNTILGVITIVFFLIYVIGSLVNTSSYMSYGSYCKIAGSGSFTFYTLITHRQSAEACYLGVQYLPLFSDSLKDPKVQIPRVMMISIVLYIISVISVMTAACSQYPGAIELANEQEPMQQGFRAIFKTSWQNGVWFSFPSMFASTLALIYCCGKQLYSFAKSGLIPKLFMETIPHLDTPWVGYVFGTVICLIITVASTYNVDIIPALSNITSLSSQIVFANALIGYLFFYYHLSELNRSFRNPLGIYGAIWGIINFDLGFLSTAFLKGTDGYIAIGIVGIYGLAAVIFYLVYMAKHQKFSEEEKQLMFKAYLINANHANRKRIRNNKVAPAHHPTNHPTHQTFSPTLNNHNLKSIVPSDHHSTLTSDMKDDVAPTPDIVHIQPPSREDNTSDANPNNTTSEKEGVVGRGGSEENLSAKILRYVSEKISQILSRNNSTGQMDEFQKLAIIENGGSMKDEEKQLALEEEVGMIGLEGGDIEENIIHNNTSHPGNVET